MSLLHLIAATTLLLLVADAAAGLLGRRSPALRHWIRSLALAPEPTVSAPSPSRKERRFPFSSRINFTMIQLVVSPSRTSGVRSARPIVPPVSATARLISFSNCRTLPGQE